MKFTHNPKNKPKQQWELTLAENAVKEPVLHDHGEEVELTLQNCFRIQHNRLLLATDQYIIIFDDKFEQIIYHPINELFHEDAGNIYTMDGGFIDNNKYLIGLGVIDDLGVIEAEKCR